MIAVEKVVVVLVEERVVVEGGGEAKLVVKVKDFLVCLIPALRRQLTDAAKRMAGRVFQNETQEFRFCGLAKLPGLRVLDPINEGKGKLVWMKSQTDEFSGVCVNQRMDGLARGTSQLWSGKSGDERSSMVPISSRRR